MHLILLAIWMILGATPAYPVTHGSYGPGEPARLAATSMAEPLVRFWPTSQAEDQHLADALRAYRDRSKIDDPEALQTFLNTHPGSGWAPALQLNLGLAYRHYGYVSRAETAWQAAWQQGRQASDPDAKALVDRAVGELALLYASLGASDKLEALFVAVGQRPITGSATEKVQVARETLDLVTKDPRHLFNCGPLALRSLLVASGIVSKQTDALRWYRASPNGTNLAEVAGLASKAGLSHRLIRRHPGQPVPVPSVMHFKAGHFAAILAAENGRYHVFDPVFGGHDLWLTADAVDAEASGGFLVPTTSSEGESHGWRELTLAEAGRVWGKGPTNGVVPGDADDPLAKDTPDPDAGPEPQPNCGMCRYDIKEATVGLTLWDVPVGYAPAIGPKVRTRISYNQREDSQPAVFGFYNVSPKWTLNWLTYVTDDPQNPGGSVSRTLSTGGAYYYTGYSAATGAFSPQSGDGSTLIRVAAGPITYQRQLRDGTTEFYSQSDGRIAYPRRIFISKIVDPQGNALTFNYDSQSRLTSLTDATGRQTTFGYTQPYRPLLVTQITDPFGRSAKLSYDAFGRLSSITDVIGLTSRFAYDANGLVNAMTTPYGTTTFAYTAPGTSSPPRFLDVTDPLGFHEREEWLEPAAIPASDPAASVPQGMPVAPVNQYLTYRNSFYWNKAAYSLAGCAPSGGCDYTKARIRHFVHAGNGIKGVAIESEKYPFENRVWYNYPGQTSSIYGGSFNKPSAIGRVLDDGTTQIKKFEYDAISYNLIRSTDPLGRTTYFTYAPNGLDLLAVTQKSGAATFATLAQFTYNGQHRPIIFTDANAQTSTYAYNAAGQLIATTNALGETTRFTYDATGNLLSVVNANGANAATFTYDASNRIRTYTDSEGWTASYDYDDADRITAVTYPDGTAQTYTYDRLDLVAYRDRQFRTWSYGYDANQRLTTQVDSSGNRMLFGYSPDGKLASLTDAKGNVTRWTYDLQGRLTTKQYADSSTLTYAYETTTSRLRSITDALSQTKQYGYFRDDRLSGVSYLNPVNPTPNVSYTDDPYFPRTLSMTDGTGTTTYTYAAGFTPGAFQLAQECLVPTGGTSGCAWTIAHGYDALGRPNARTVSGSGAETVSYDALGRVTSHASDLGSFALGYLGQTEQPTLRQLLPTTQNLKTAWRYLSNAGDRRLAGIANTGLSTSQHLNLQFTSGSETPVTGVTETSDASPALPQAGSQTAQYNALNQLTTLSGQSFTYDANGNLLSDGQRTYAWDAENRLVRITYSGQSDKVSAFAYDGLSRRIAISETPSGGGTATVTSYVWCGEAICQSRSAAGTVLRAYLAEGEVVSVPPAQRLYYGTDQIGSVRRVFSSAGAASAYGYDPYGRALQGTASVADRGFAGMLLHAASGLYLTQYRAYDPAMGRWISRDPLGEFTSDFELQFASKRTLSFEYASLYQNIYSKNNLSISVILKIYTYIDKTIDYRLNKFVLSLNEGTNLYSYVGQSPLSRIDPQGLSTFQCDGFPSGCSSGGSYGTTATHCISGRNLCRECAIKYLSLENEPEKVRIRTLNRFLRMEK